MASNMNKKGPGDHYSGNNPIPNIHKFVENLDADKKERDKRINKQLQNQNGSEAVDHVNGQKTRESASRKVVTDPVTGREVTVEDVNKDFMKAVDNPQVRTRRVFYMYTNAKSVPLALCTKCQSRQEYHSKN